MCDRPQVRITHVTRITAERKAGPKRLAFARSHFSSCDGQLLSYAVNAGAISMFQTSIVCVIGAMKKDTGVIYQYYSYYQHCYIKKWMPYITMD